MFIFGNKCTNSAQTKLIQNIRDRYLYWSDWGDNAHIGRIGMDGTDRNVIIQDKITWPNGLTLDFVNDRIYWADAREDYIAFASLDGSNRHTGITHKTKRSFFTFPDVLTNSPYLSLCLENL